MIQIDTAAILDLAVRTKALPRQFDAIDPDSVLNLHKMGWLGVALKGRSSEEVIQLLKSAPELTGPICYGLLQVNEAAILDVLDQSSGPAQDEAKFYLMWGSLRRGEFDDLWPYVAEQGAAAFKNLDAHKLGRIRFLEGSLCLKTQPEPGLANEKLDTAVAMLREAKDSVLLRRVLTLRAGAHKSAGILQSAWMDATAALEIALKDGCLKDALLAANQCAMTAQRMGEFRVAADVYETAIKICSQLPMGEIEFQARIGLARMHIIRGEYETAIGEVNAASTSFPENDNPRYLAVLEEVRGEVAMAMGKSKTAKAHFEEAEKMLRDRGFKSYELPEVVLRQAELLLHQAQFKPAYDMIKKALPLMPKGVEGLERGRLFHAYGLAAWNMARPRDTENFLRIAEKSQRALGDRYGLCLLLLDRTDILSKEDPETALADAGEALGLATEMEVPLELERARTLVDRCTALLAQQQRDLAEKAQSKRVKDGIIAESEKFQKLLHLATRVARKDRPVLVTGETGSGKEIVAHYLHEESDREDKPFVAVNCAAIPDNLFESELFGHVKGSFTGADKDRVGLVERADGGTLFLDEVGEMPLPLQAKMLRLLQQGTYRRVGESEERSADVRIVAATNRDLLAMSEGANATFRADLYYRLNYLSIEIPSLRERPDDIRALAKHFLARESVRDGSVYWLDKSCWIRVLSYHWPGNVRELEAALCSATAHAASDGCIRDDDLPVHMMRTTKRAMQAAAGEADLNDTLIRTERDLILDALREVRYSRIDAARRLGIGRNTLYDKMRKLGIQPEQRA